MIRRAMSDTLRTARGSVATAFAVHAFVSGSWAPRIPAIKSDLALDNGELGIALSGLAVGLLLGTRVAGRLIDRIGTRLPVRVGLPLMCATLIGPALATELVALTVAFLVLGLVSGFLDVTMNAAAVAVERGYRRPIMSGFHALWSGGLLAGAVVAAAAAAVGAGVLLHFALVAAILASLAAVVTRGLLHAEAEHATIDLTDPTLPRGAAWLPVVLLGLVAFSAFAGEGSAADWSAVYMTETVRTGTGLASVAFVAFSLGMIAARLAGDGVSERFGPSLTVRTGGALAAGGMALALAAPHPLPALIGYLLVGVGLGPIVPITFSAAGNLDRGRPGSQLGLVVTIGYVGSIVAPIVVGWTADVLGLRVALIFPLALALVVARLGFAVTNAARRSETVTES
jgi:MFS family permease